MEYQKIMHLFDSTFNHPSKFRQRVGLKYMMTHAEGVIPIDKLNLRLQFWNQVYVVMVLHTYLWKEQ